MYFELFPLNATGSMVKILKIRGVSYPATVPTSLADTENVSANFLYYPE